MMYAAFCLITRKNNGSELQRLSNFLYLFSAAVESSMIMSEEITDIRGSGSWLVVSYMTNAPLI